MIPIKEAGGLLSIIGGLRTPVLIFLGFLVVVGAFLYQNRDCPDLEVRISTNETRLLANCELVAVAYNTRAEGWTRDERARSTRAHYRVDMIQGDTYAGFLKNLLPLPRKWKGT